MFGMGTGGSLQLSSPETFSLPFRPPRLRSLRSCFRFASTLALAPAFRLRSASTRSPRFRFALTPHLQNCTGLRVDQLFKHSSNSFSLRSSPRPISIAKLHTLPCFHRRPIYLIVSEGSYLLIVVAVFFFRGASRLDAFSVYPVRTSLPSCAFGKTTVAPEVRPSRSSRTRDSSRHDSCAHDG